MAFSNEQHRNRYATDPAHRADKLAANRSWRTAHRDELNAEWSEKWRNDEAFREARKAAARIRRLAKYGLTQADYERMLREQKGMCLFCHRRPARGLVVDHDHATNRVRGLLCDKCNSGLGFFEDDAARMRTGADYIDRANGIREARLNITAVIPTARFEVTLNAPQPRASRDTPLGIILEISAPACSSRAPASIRTSARTRRRTSWSQSP
jgi:hypothetical protein